jgi:capsular polysaccharide export protein
VSADDLDFEPSNDVVDWPHPSLPCEDRPRPTSPEPVGQRTFLFVSAPFGPFSRQLARELRRGGARALRVILNGGDLLDWGGANALAFRGPCGDWTTWLAGAIAANRVTDMIAYGDSSPHASLAIDLAARLGVRTHVLEQGYFRPNWITLERGGVNANSRLPRDPDWYRRHPAAAGSRPAHAIGRTTPAAVLQISAYHAAMYLGVPLFPVYRAHYSVPAIRQAIGHVGRLARQQISRTRRRKDFQTLVSGAGPIFLCALQRPGDSQLWRHSDFASAPGFAEHVVKSFAAHAPPDARLIVRPHPLDPGLVPHAQLVARAARRGGVGDRVKYVDHGKLHEVLPHVAGVVCVNSTAGLAAIEFGKPTITLGRAIYDMPGLTHQGGLDGFWSAPQSPDGALYEAFRHAVIAETQVNGAYATAKGRRLAVSEMAERLLARSATEPRLSPAPATTGRQWRSDPASLGLAALAVAPD